MTTTAIQTCIGEPVSWLRLETFALEGGRDAKIREHLDACPACKHCHDEIERDVVALPPLAVPETKKRPWWHLALPPALVIAAAAILVIVLRPGIETERRTNTVTIKGVGVVVIKTVRERAGAIQMDALTYRDGDRFKVVVTCPPDHTAHVELRVREAGTEQTDRPIAPADLVCGNDVVIPGAFSISGTKNNEVKTACVTLRPE